MICYPRTSLLRQSFRHDDNSGHQVLIPRKSGGWSATKECYIGMSVWTENHSNLFSPPPDVPNYTNPPSEVINNSQMHLILTGATGLVGSSVLDAMLKNTNISKISILSRRPVPMAEDAKDSRVRVITHRDFGSYEPELLDQLKDADGCVWALGTSQNNVNQE